MTSREQQSNKVNAYMLERTIPSGGSCGFNCRSLNDKTHVDVESVLMRGRISEPVDNSPSSVPETAEMVNHQTTATDYEPEFGEPTRISKACYFEQTYDRFDPVAFQNRNYNSQALFGTPSRLTKYNV